MLRKFLVIQNVGRFENYNVAGDVEFRKFNVIYAENGRGKTTLSHIIRSLATGDPSFVNERNTLSTSVNPHIEVLLETGNKATFKDGQWDIQIPIVEIFDSTFVNQNVFSGHYVDIDHRRNLYLFVIGEYGVNLSNQIYDLDEKIKDCNREIQDKKSDIEMVITSELSVDEFARLIPIADIDTQVEAKEREVEALKKAEEIIAKPELQKIILPTLVYEELVNLLRRQLTDVSTAAMRHVENHISSLGGTSEMWIGEGLRFSNDGEKCPFCGQSIAGVELVEAYQSYFSRAYNQLKESVNIYLQKVLTDFSEVGLLGITNQVSSNDDLINYWSQYLTITPPIIEITEVQTAWKNLLAATQDLLKRKQLAPLEAIESGLDYAQLYSVFGQMGEGINIYNVGLNLLDEQIESLKTSAATGVLENSQKELGKLQDTKKRFEAKADEACKAYLEAVSKKSQLAAQKEITSGELKSFTEKILDSYENVLNKYLEQFGASFRIKAKKLSFSGGKPSTDYYIVLDGKEMALGKPNETGMPTFKSLLSDGDKNTLAFAFFMARLESMQDTELAQKVIIFDDPISSLDHHRKTATKQGIINISAKAKQVIVLSHDPYYLRTIWEDCIKANTRMLEIMRSGNQSGLRAWDIEQATKGDYYRNYDILAGYLEAGATLYHPLSAAKCIRPLIEGNLRIRFPKSFRDDEWLGDFVGKIREAVAPDELCLLKPLYQELSDINDYSKKFHHSTNPNAGTEMISDAELEAYIKRTFKVISGILQV